MTATTNRKPLEMDPGIRARWVAALRSGEYRQGRSYLRWADTLCCLGVLCELAVADGVIPAPKPGTGSAWLYDNCAGMLPSPVAEWAGLHSGDPECDGKRLSDLNDGIPEEHASPSRPATEPWTFAQIADVIEGGAR